MKLFISLQSLLIICLPILPVSCHKEDTAPGKSLFGHGIFITNEGPFMSGTGTVTFYDPDSNLVNQDIFESVNGRPLGNIVQSMSVFNGKGYIVVNNAAKVEVVDLQSFVSTATITGMVLPRYFLGINDKKAYVSDWAGVINIVDIASNTVTGTIPAGTGPEIMLRSGKYVFALNAGGLTIDSTITVIDHSTDKVAKTLQVFDRPTGIAEDASGKVWVMCSGKGFNGWSVPGDTKGHLVRIDPATLSMDLDIPFDDISLHPEKLVINGNKNQLYFLYNNGIYRYNTALAGGNPEKVASHANLYALAYDMENDYLLASDPLDYQQDGWVIRFRADNGASVDSIRAGIIPGCILVN